MLLSSLLFYLKSKEEKEMVRVLQECSYLKPGGWVKGKVIGSGSHGNVHLAMNKSSGELFIAKFSQSEKVIQLLDNEAKFLACLDSPYVVRYLGRNLSEESSNGETTLSIFMEYMPGGSLSDVAEKFGGLLDEEVIRLYTKEILHGLKYIHEQGIVHCDVKCRNLLLGSSGNIKLADFGCARRIKDSECSGYFSLSCQDMGGTPLWMAPEVLRKEQIDFASDIWSLGCTVIEMATGKSPWFGQFSDPMAAVFKITFSDEKPRFPNHLSEEGLDFLAKCLERNPDNRFTAEELLDHPFISEKYQKKVANSPASVFDIQILEKDDDSNESKTCTDCDYGGRNPFSTRNCEWRKKQNSQHPLESDFDSSEDWITVRSA